MDWLPTLMAGLGLPAVATAIGVAWRARTGRLRETPAGELRAETDAAALDLSPGALGSSATLVQFSTEYCSRCPATARQLARVAARYDGVRHVEVDVTHRADLAGRFHVLQTPTTLILDARGHASARIGGVPRLDAVQEHLDRLTRRTHVAS
ncbi:TlpA family protein disulfide reductase [Agromyces bauzanensis]|uniref:Thiol reductase thioredoxin n=1 Tax=Agromyces bauzanensis TaxID=1308924 RepID=A0A917UR08_9MICO|nr:thioredoxin family protein [Agromyces bauzanensis]GGJ78374.1 thiol reductase thioredoxin [Agromyces bauzanensis]